MCECVFFIVSVGVGGVPSKTFDFVFLINGLAVIYQAWLYLFLFRNGWDLTLGVGCVIVDGLVKATGRSHNKGVAQCILHTKAT